jgi:hypothetical protein
MDTTRHSPRSTSGSTVASLSRQRPMGSLLAIGTPPKGAPGADLLYRPAKRRHIRPVITIVHYDHKPKTRKAKPPVEFPCGRIVSARKPKPRLYGEIREGVPDEAQRTELIRQFIERTLKHGPHR